MDLSSALGSAGAGDLAFGSSGILRVERSSSGSARTAIRRPTGIPLDPLSTYGGMLVNMKEKSLEDRPAHTKILAMIPSS